MDYSLYESTEEDACQLPTASNDSNSTQPADEKDQGLYIAYNVMLAVITVVIMFSMGSGIRVSDILIVVKRPVGPVIGVVCQCFVMPAACFGYALALQLASNLAIGMVLVGSCPGGSISNIITFWIKADVCLSICMTTISTTLAILFLPLNMFIYSRYWIEDISNLPYVNMVITVLYVWAAALLGFIFGKKFPAAVPYLTKIGSVAALVLILAAGVIQGQLYPELFNLPWEAWVGAITMPVIGCVLGFLLALIFCQKHEQRVAIGLETGIQNTALALTVIAITFPSSYQASCYSQFVLLYTTFQVVLGIGTIILVWFYGFVRYRETPCNMKHLYDGAPENEMSLENPPPEETDPEQCVSIFVIKGDAFADPVTESTESTDTSSDDKPEDDSSKEKENPLESEKSSDLEKQDTPTEKSQTSQDSVPSFFNEAPPEYDEVGNDIQEKDAPL